MSQDLHSEFADAQRAELESVVEALSRSPRLARLLRYMGEKFFAGEVDQLNEYNIATDVFGRSKTDFDATEDAIARVESHRLRKRLKEFYETEGKNHRIQVTLPPGKYVPLFVARSAEEEPTVGESNDLLTQESVSPVTDGRWFRFRGSLRNRKYWLLTVTVFLVAMGTFYLLRSREPSKDSSASPSSAGTSEVIASNLATAPIHILAGYSGNPRTDSAGVVWSPDRFFSGGSSWRRAAVSIARTNDPFLFDYSRNGDFAYQVPLAPGLYEVHLHFVYAAGGNLSTFRVAINGEYVLTGFDVNSDAMGENIADERVFRDVSPDKDGFVRIEFKGEIGPPMLNAIEILPGLAHKQNPIRLIMQNTPYTDLNGRFWHPDDYFMNGRPSAQSMPLPGSADPELFVRERYGHFTYAIPVDTRGRYTVVLHFVEFYFGSAASGTGGVGSRVFRVMCNGETLLDNFDIFKEAGSLHEVTKTFRHIRPSAQGKLNITFEPIVNNATISGIEVLDESE